MKIILIDINGEEVDIHSRANEFSREIDVTQEQGEPGSTCSEKVRAWLQQHPSKMITLEFGGRIK